MSDFKWPSFFFYIAAGTAISAGGHGLTDWRYWLIFAVCVAGHWMRSPILEKQS